MQSNVVVIPIILLAFSLLVMTNEMLESCM